MTESIEKFTSSQENGPEILDKETVEKIEAASIYVDEKVGLLLLKTGDKPVTDITVGGEWWSQGKEKKHLREEDVKSVEDLLSVLSLPYKKKRVRTDVQTSTDNAEQGERREVKDFAIGKDEQSLKNILQAKNQIEFGKAYGYPETAVRVYVRPMEHSFMRWELPADVKQSDFYPFIMFRVSKENWREEIKTAQKWAEVVRMNSQKLFEEYSEYIRDADSGYEKGKPEGVDKG
ncbi:hypothetical protein KJ786_00115 [Patescibacteria group bacterium]|nr:hypothetical protein [Patescibacteria group bacterium]